MQKTQQVTVRLADRTTALVVALWSRVESGDLSEDEFVALAAAAVARANAQGVSLADLGLAGSITRAQKAPTRPLGLQPDAMQVDQDRIALALRTIIAGAVAERLFRLKRLARAEPLVTVSKSVQKGLLVHRMGWIRVTDPDPCPLCTSLADGVVRPAEVPMARHRGCACIQQPVPL